MTRRLFLRIGAFAAAACALGKSAFAAVLPVLPPLTIAQLVAVSFEPVRQLRLDSERREAPELFALRASGQLVTRPLGPVVICLVELSPGVFADDYYEPRVWYSSIIWSKADEERCDTEAKKIDFVSRLLSDAFDAHTALLVDEIGPHRAAISQDYSFQRTEIHELQDFSGYALNIYTAIAVLNPATARRVLLT